MLGTNNVTGTGWIPVYTNLPITCTTTAEQALKVVLPPDNRITYLYYRFVVREVLGTPSSSSGAVFPIRITGLRFTIIDSRI